jgi:membrane protein DedA with SNARE-associated domain
VSVHHLLDQYGYLAVFLLVMVESLGIPLPGETILVAAGTYAGTTHRLSIAAVVAVAAVAAVVGDNLGYLIGAKGGYRLLRRYGPLVRLDATKVKIGRYVFDRQGPKVVFFGRFVSILRTYAAFLAGTNKMRWRRFAVWNVAGGVVWAALFGIGAYLAGNAISRVSTTLTIVLGAAAVVVVAAAVVLVRRQAGRLAVKAEAAYPGPLPER